MARAAGESDAPTVSFVSLGCVKNLVDSEVLLGRLARDRFVLSADPDGTDIIVINTCGFLREAEEESLEHIREAVKMKEEGRVRAVVVAGCLPQRYGPAFAEKVPGVDAVMGITDRGEISRVARALLGRRNGPRRMNLVSADLPGPAPDRERLRLTPRHTAYLRLSDGCSRTCTFCVIPAIRGEIRSKPKEIILDEARELAADGAVEVNLIAQDTTTYGLDLYGRLALPELLSGLAEVEGLRWIRLLYAYPSCVDDALIAEMARNPKVVPYIDMPIQHTRDRVLLGMARGVTAGRQREIIRRLREGLPGLVLRTTILVGFPGESEEDFEGLLEDLRDLRFERLGAFAYSREKGTRADDLPGHLPEEVKEERFRRVMTLQQEIAFEMARSWIGRPVEVLLDRATEEGYWEGRTYGDAPEIDPVIRVCGEGGTEGRICRVRVTASDGYDLVGEIRP